MNTLQVIAILIVVVFLAYLYRRYETKYLYERDNKNYDIQNYLLGNLTRDDIGSIKKPLLWMYIPHEYNSRNWLSFGSRSSTHLNQPYIGLTVKSIIQKCNESFHIVVIDDNSFERLLPNWKYLNSNLNCKIRLYGLMNILYKYGGMLTPMSFVCYKDLIELYYKGIRNDCMFVGENVNKATMLNSSFVPDPMFAGCKKENGIMLEFIKYVESLIEKDYTYGYKIEGNIQTWLSLQINERKINLIDAYELGVKDKQEKPILVDNLLKNDYLNIDTSNIFGIWIPSKDILSRTNYEWFARMSEEQVLNSNVILGKYIFLSVIPDSGKEGMENKDWVGYWNTPLYKGLYGLQPIYLGQDVPRNKSISSEPKFVGVI
jgi:hypothetical protein